MFVEFTKDGRKVLVNMDAVQYTMSEVRRQDGEAVVLGHTLVFMGGLMLNVHEDPSMFLKVIRPVDAEFKPLDEQRDDFWQANEAHDNQ